MIKVSAPAKLILFGEHAVVYGEMAIATAINKRVYITACELKEEIIVIKSKNLNKIIEVKINEKLSDPIVKVIQTAIKNSSKEIGIGVEISSEIPIGVGLGSSAAVSTATAYAVLSLLKNDVSLNEVFNVSFEGEKIAHGNPSGIDTAITVFGKTIAFKQGNIELIDAKELCFVIGNTGIKKNTKEIVEKVRRYIEDPKMAYNLFTIGSIARKAKYALKNGDIHEIGRLMNKNHLYLKSLGVSCSELEKLVNAALNAGAYGAKLTGAGGGGCMIALTNSPERIKDALLESGATETYIVNINEEGVKIE